MTLSPADSHHLARVVRLRAGDAVELIDGAGTRWAAVVIEAGDRARVRVEAATAVPAPPVSVTLYQGLIDGGRLDTLVEKAAELGVEEVAVVVTERVRRVPGADAWERRRERLLRVAAERRPPVRPGAAAAAAGTGTVPGSRERDPRRGGLPDRPTRRCVVAVGPHRPGGRTGAREPGGGPGGGVRRGRGRRRPRGGPDRLRAGRRHPARRDAALVAVSLALAAGGALEGAAG